MYHGQVQSLSRVLTVSFVVSWGGLDHNLFLFGGCGLRQHPKMKIYVDCDSLGCILPIYYCCPPNRKPKRSIKNEKDGTQADPRKQRTAPQTTK